MRQWVGSVIGALVLTVTSIAPALAQGGAPAPTLGGQPGSSSAAGVTAYWPGYGNYGYGSGFDYDRNAYSYNRAIFAQGRSMPGDTVALYGGYMPNAYYTGMAYDLARAPLFASGQAFCQTAGSFLYCADIDSGAGAMLMSMGQSNTRIRSAILDQLAGAASVYSGVLSTRSSGDTAYLVGSLNNSDGEQVTVSCAGPMRAYMANLNCR